MAPEILLASDRHPTFACDIWSFGVLLFELATNGNALPYAALSNAEVVEAVLAGRPPGVIADSPEALLDIVHACRFMQPERRPRIDELAFVFRQLSASVNDMGKAEHGPGDGPIDVAPPVEKPTTATAVATAPAPRPADRRENGPAPELQPQPSGEQPTQATAVAPLPASRPVSRREGLPAGYVSHKAVQQLLDDGATFSSTTL